MDYVYDVVLNFQPVYYEFYEWQPTDKISKKFESISDVKLDDTKYLE